MTDTPEHIKAIQLKIWLSKPAMERLKQMMTDNDNLFRFWANTHRIEDKVISSEIQLLPMIRSAK